MSDSMAHLLVCGVSHSYSLFAIFYLGDIIQYGLYKVFHM